MTSEWRTADSDEPTLRGRTPESLSRPAAPGLPALSHFAVHCLLSAVRCGSPCASSLSTTNPRLVIACGA